tara:strand:- start:144 stop:422 length:279 start_codon:yes stop_codon:yes gene_type:complete
MNYCTLSDEEMQEIEKEHDSKMEKLFEHLSWEPRRGDLVRQKHGAKTVGLIVRVDGTNITVHWQRHNPNNVGDTDYEVLHLRYLELLEAAKR